MADVNVSIGLVNSQGIQIAERSYFCDRAIIDAAIARRGIVKTTQGAADTPSNFGNKIDDCVVSPPPFPQAPFEAVYLFRLHRQNQLNFLGLIHETIAEGQWLNQASQYDKTRGVPLVVYPATEADRLTSALSWSNIPA